MRKAADVAVAGILTVAVDNLAVTVAVDSPVVAGGNLAEVVGTLVVAVDTPVAETVDNSEKTVDKVAVAVESSAVAVDRVVAVAAAQVDTPVVDTLVSVDTHSLLYSQKVVGTAGS